MCTVTSTQHRVPSARWYFIARSKGTPKTDSKTLLRSTGKMRNDIVSVRRWPKTRAAMCVFGKASLYDVTSFVMRSYLYVQ